MALENHKEVNPCLTGRTVSQAPAMVKSINPKTEIAIHLLSPKSNSSTPLERTREYQLD